MSVNNFVYISGKIALIGAAQHPHAARRLKEAWRHLEWVEAHDEESLPTALPRVRLILESGRPEGSYSIHSARTSTPTILVTGGPFSGVIYGVEALTQRHSETAGSGVRVSRASVDESPALSYRTFWTWDHSSNWDLTQIGHQEIGVFNPYGKPPGGFLSDYKRMVDFCSAHQIAAIIVYGFLRDSHGGVGAAQELCQYANERGVRILPGIAIGSYGGVYWEGNHRYNLATWLSQNSGFASDMEKDIGFQIQDLSFPLSFPRSDYTLSACPSEPRNMEWMEEAVSWLAETFEIGGINIESGDYGVCGCDRCITRRGERESGDRRYGHEESWSHSDLADNFPRLHTAATKARDDLWIFCELQWDNLFDPEAQAPLSALPSGAIYQHTLNRSYWNRVESELTRKDIETLPTETNIFRSQFASQWNGDERTERYAYSAPVFSQMARKAHEVGVQGLTVWGEASPFNVSNELSYLAFGRFAFDPTLSWIDFIRQEVSPRLGGDAAGESFLSIVDELDTNHTLAITRLRELQGRATDGITSTSGDARGRWTWLAYRVAQRLEMSR